MAVKAGEESPLLAEQRNAGSSATSVQSTSDEERLDEGKANQHVGTGRGFLIALSLWALIFLQASNMSAITTTQSRIAEDLDAFAEASWFTSSYMIAMSSFSPLAARMSQIFSPRNCILVSALLFSAGGFIASQAPTLGVFLLGRAVSGMGGAGIFTIAFVLVLELAGKKRRGLFIGLVNSGFTMGVSLGAVIAGALLPVVGWRFLFGIQSPLALVAGISLFFSLPSSFTSGSKDAGEQSVMSKLARIDYLGAVTLTAALVSFLFGLSFPKVLWQPIVASVFLLGTFLLTELRFASDPIIPITVLKSRGTLLACLAQLGMMSARWMVLFYSPVYAIAVRGWGPATAGSMLIPTNSGFALGTILAGWLHIRRPGSFWTACVVSMFLFSSTFLVISQFTSPASPAWLFIVSIFANGLCTGAAINYSLAHVLHLTPPSTHFVSSSLLATSRGFAGSFGSAIGGGFFIRVLKAGLEKGFEANGGLGGREDLVRRLMGGPALVQALKGVEKSIAVNSYVGALHTLFLAVSGVALIVVFVQAGTGWRGGKDTEERTVGNGIRAGNEEWEEGMEQGV